MKFKKISTGYSIYLADESHRLHNKSAVLIGGKIHYRFMDRFYIPDRVYRLSEDFVIELNEMRRKYFKDVIDNSYNEAVYEQILLAVSKRVIKPKNILDFGCGEGKALPAIEKAFPYSDIYGLDIRSLQNHSYYEITTCSMDKKIPYKDNQFSVVFSFFVLHFRISDNQISELRRILSPNGIFAFNLINSSEFKVIDRLSDAGFSIINDFDINSASNDGRGFLFLARKS